MGGDCLAGSSPKDQGPVPAERREVPGFASVQIVQFRPKSWIDLTDIPLRNRQ